LGFGFPAFFLLGKSFLSKRAKKGKHFLSVRAKRRQKKAEAPSGGLRHMV
jgi:hypothetical protein